MRYRRRGRHAWGGSAGAGAGDGDGEWRASLCAGVRMRNEWEWKEGGRRGSS